MLQDYDRVGIVNRTAHTTAAAVRREPAALASLQTATRLEERIISGAAFRIRSTRTKHSLIRQPHWRSNAWTHSGGMLHL